MKQAFSKYFLPIIIFVVLAVIVFVSFDYVESEGFSSTDEGVVLAQSWRVVNGEIPHADFVSIRPAGSAYLHAINFIFPGALVANARWFVLFQFFMIALVFSIFLIKELEKKNSIKVHPIAFFSLLCAGFTITVLNYNLYSWTTIDAVFWSIMALPLLFSESKYKIAIGLMFLGFAALSRQTFALVVTIAYLHFLWNFRKQFLKMIPVYLVGALPFILYLIMLLSNSAIEDFVSQMTGRTEFFQTAILQYVKKFISSYSTPINIICVGLSIVLYFKRKSGMLKNFTDKGYHNIVVFIISVPILTLIIRQFTIDEIDIYQLPFSFFFSALALLIFHYILYPKNFRLKLVALSIILIAWLSSISLGDNAPVFSSGPLFLVILVLLADIYSFNKEQNKTILFLTNKYFILVLSVAIFSLGLVSQQKINYRDNSKDLLVSGLRNASEDFGDISTNPSMNLYYNDLVEVYNSLESAENNTVVFPHNAMFYPLMKTQNPMSLDWLIANEYIGQEDRVEKDFTQMLSSSQVYFIVDKIDTRIIKDGIKIREYAPNDLIYKLIIENCTKLNIDSEFVEVYISN